MNIKFKIKDAKYTLTSDSRQFILVTAQGYTQYFPKLEQVLEHLYQTGLRDNTVDSFRALVKHSENIKESVLRISKMFALTGE